MLYQIKNPRLNSVDLGFTRREEGSLRMKQHETKWNKMNQQNTIYQQLDCSNDIFEIEN